MDGRFSILQRLPVLDGWVLLKDAQHPRRTEATLGTSFVLLNTVSVLHTQEHASKDVFEFVWFV